nr:hypothetical protein [uncultured Rhodopila sp.]
MSQYAEQVAFGSGTIIATQVGLSGVATPARVGILQDAQIDFSADLKELYGQNRYAIALAAGKTKVEVKAKFAGIRGNLWNSTYFNATTVATQTLFADAEAGAVPGSVAYTVTVANSAKFLADAGVFYAATGLPFACVASAPAVGQYMVAAGVYTFAAADANAAVYISYTYSSTSGLVIPITNVKMGVSPSFKIVIATTFDGRQANFVFNQCQSAKLSIPAKQDDWLISELDFQIAADIAGNIGTINLAL